MARRIESGNVVGFVLVGALLLAVLVGGIYVLRHGNSGSVAVTNTNSSAPKSSPSSSSDTTSNTSTASDQALRDALNSQSSSTSNSSNTSATTSSSLPTTGPEDSLMPMLAVGLLTGVSFAYIRSRRLI